MREKFALADWGHARVPLHPLSPTNTYGRDGFFLHGGIFKGSAGCVDVGSNDTKLLNALLYSDSPIILQVKYYQW